MVVDPAWLAKNLDKYHVVLDTRSAGDSAKSNIKSAVSFPAVELVKWGKTSKPGSSKAAKNCFPD